MLSLSEIIQPFHGENDEHHSTHIISLRICYMTLFAHTKSLVGSKTSENFEYLLKVFQTANGYIGNDKSQIPTDEKGRRPRHKKIIPKFRFVL